LTPLTTPTLMQICPSLDRPYGLPSATDHCPRRASPLANFTGRNFSAGIFRTARSTRGSAPTTIAG
jgi:hypothetical protein